MSDEYQKKRQARQLPRLKTFMDVVYAVMLWRIFTQLPILHDFPEASSIWALISHDPDRIVMVVVGVFFIVTYWVQNNRLFSHIVRTDAKHTTLSILQVFCLLLYLYSVGLGIRFDNDLVAMLLQSSTLATAGFMAMWGWSYAVGKKVLIDPDMPQEYIPYMKVTVLPEPITACFTIPFAFVGQIAWDVAWLIHPCVLYLTKRYVDSQKEAIKSVDATDA